MVRQPRDQTLGHNPNSELTSGCSQDAHQQRQGELANLMEQGQANVAALFELGLAMSQRQQEEQP